MCADGAVDESLNRGGGCGKLIGQKDFAVCITQVDEMGVELVEHPGRCPSWHRRVESKFISLVR